MSEAGVVVVAEAWGRPSRYKARLPGDVAGQRRPVRGEGEGEAWEAAASILAGRVDSAGVPLLYPDSLYLDEVLEAGYRRRASCLPPERTLGELVPGLSGGGPASWRVVAEASLARLSATLSARLGLLAEAAASISGPWGMTRAMASNTVFMLQAAPFPAPRLLGPLGHAEAEARRGYLAGWRAGIVAAAVNEFLHDYELEAGGPPRHVLVAARDPAVAEAVLVGSALYSLSLAADGLDQYPLVTVLELHEGDPALLEAGRGSG